MFRAATALVITLSYYKFQIKIKLN